MPVDMDAMVTEVVLMVKTALQPVLERLATVEQSNKDLRDRVMELNGIRDRVVAVETKSAIQVMTFDTEPLIKRLDALEARPPMPGPAGADGKDGVPGKDGAPGAVGVPGPPGERGPEGLPGASGRDGRDGLPGIQGEKGVAGLDGKDGQPGRDGLNGKDGSAGLSFEGVYQDGKSYDMGHVVFYAGQSWHCNMPTTTKPEMGVKEWAVLVKRGRDGKDGRDLASPLPIVKVS